MLELEEYIIDPKDWDLCPFKEGIDMARQFSSHGISTGISHHENVWYVLVSMGQGPTIVWERKQGELNE